jgi:aspartate/glutamate racemase
MEQTFYTDRLREHGLEVLVPNDADRAEVHRIIYDALCLDVIRDDSWPSIAATKALAPHPQPSWTQNPPGARSVTQYWH